MAKGLRSSRNKTNNSKLRSNVFGPAETARKERLSAKLIELASKPQPNPEQGTKMTDGEKVTTQEVPEELEAHSPAREEGTLFVDEYYKLRLEGLTRLTATIEMSIDQADRPSSTREPSSSRERKEAILIFATGFFPYKPFIPGRATFQDSQYGGQLASAPFDKVIFMVVDALRRLTPILHRRRSITLKPLRSDFVYSNNSGFQFTQALIRSGAAMPFTAHATSPTITMPRVKAITTGSIPSFLDVILNFAESDKTSNLASQDTWLGQLKGMRGGKLVMYGDDTWLKLFPNTFSRVDGTSSFFVSDFTEVDNNVTRNIPSELKRSDWNGMIIHYLGLDHIGHKSGPRSPHMVPKQSEMDGIVKQIYTSIETEEHLHSTLFVLCGDHGMNDAGNHGGSAEGETSPALVFISPKLQSISKGSECPLALPESTFSYYTTVEQSDIAPTLAGLLGFPIPLNNLGVFISDLLDFWDEHVKVDLLLQNARQILSIVHEAFPALSLSEAKPLDDCALAQSAEETLSCHWSKVTSLVDVHGQTDAAAAVDALTQFSKHAQHIMSSTASNYNLPRLGVGIGLAALTTVAGIAAVSTALFETQATSLWASLVFIAYGIMMFASSYVEEEQHFWYWASSGWLGWLSLKRRNAVTLPTSLDPWCAALLLVLLRIVRVWNQTGQKHAGEPDIARTVLPAHTVLLWLLVLVTYLDIIQRLSRTAVPWASRHLATAASLALGIAALGFKVAFTKADAPELLEGIGGFVPRPMEESSLVGQARAVFSSIAIMGLLTSFPAIWQRIWGGQQTKGSD
ncbi:major facilitator super transporter protein [Imshaugia aleurites]|uniref:GPI ethanolamine phosphate transferase 2 n=1 Tax=Imshaugia aleurites TaxID=172621 RepID=A0A8H3EJJ2_9LECA|nr:major facilitator super transporter protein [Imshaugia aleurites]